MPTKFFYKDLEIRISDNVYEPREDSILLAKVLEEKLKDLKPKTVLEIGCGSGFLSILASRYSNVTCVDINPKAVKTTKENAKLNKVKLNCFLSNLFENVKEKYDLIIFNPPYLPTNDNIKGEEMWSNKGIIDKFIYEVKDHINEEGSVLMVISSLSEPEKVIGEFKKHNFEANIIKTLKIPWEELKILEAKPL